MEGAATVTKNILPTPPCYAPVFPMVGTSPKLLKKCGKKPVVKLACNPSSDPHLVVVCGFFANGQHRLGFEQKWVESVDEQQFINNSHFFISDFSCFFLKKLQDPKTCHILIHIGPTKCWAPFFEGWSRHYQLNTVPFIGLLNAYVRLLGGSQCSKQ